VVGFVLRVVLISGAVRLIGIHLRVAADQEQLLPHFSEPCTHKFVVDQVEYEERHDRIQFDLSLGAVYHVLRAQGVNWITIRLITNAGDAGAPPSQSREQARAPSSGTSSDEPLFASAMVLPDK